MRLISIDHANSLPAYVQIKEQIKVAYTFGQLRQGDVLPSIRALARDLEVGEGVVRRAYRELRELGVLSSERRKQVMVNHRLVTPPDIDDQAADAARQCDRLLAWSREKRLSSIALARLLLQRALAQETASPSYVYVDFSATSAAEFAAIIGRAWEIKVASLSLDEVEKLSGDELLHFTAILVNTYRYERLLKLVGEHTERIFPVRVKLADSIVRRIRRLPGGSSVLLVFPDADFPHIGRSVVENHKVLVGEKWRFEGAPFSRVADLAALAADGNYRLIIVSVHIWNQVPEKAKRLPMVIPNRNEPDLESLEEIRLQTGVLA